MSVAIPDRPRCAWPDGAFAPRTLRAIPTGSLAFAEEIAALTHALPRGPSTPGRRPPRGVPLVNARGADERDSTPA